MYFLIIASKTFDNQILVNTSLNWPCDQIIMISHSQALAVEIKYSKCNNKQQQKLLRIYSGNSWLLHKSSIHLRKWKTAWQKSCKSYKCILDRFKGLWMIEEVPIQTTSVLCLISFNFLLLLILNAVFVGAPTMSPCLLVMFSPLSQTNCSMYQM